MKKYIAFILCIVYIFSANVCFAFSELNYLKDVKKDTLIPQVEAVLIGNSYEIKNKNAVYSVYSVSSKKPDRHVSIVLQQSGKNLFYYFESDDSSKKIHKKVLKLIKNLDIVYEKSEDASHLTNFSKIVQKTITGEKTKYTFETPKPAVYQQTAAVKKEDNTTLKGFVGKIPKGTKMDVYLQGAINTATALKGDSVTSVLKSDWVYKNCVVAQQGSLLYGSLSEANRAKLGSRNGSVKIVFNNLVTPKGKTYKITTDPIEFNVTNDGKVKKVVTSTLAYAAIGALLGLGIAAMTGDTSNLATGAIIGAGIGGGGALATNVIEKGVDAEIPAYTDMEVELASPLSVVLSY